jgi:AraC-like DNA-binding protein
MSIAPDVYRKVVSAKLYIDLNFRDPIDLERLSQEACLSRFHFHRLFTRIYRLTPHQYLTRRRIEQARLSLATDKLTITEICNDVGFESIGSFSTLFKKEIGHAPGNYRTLAWEQRTRAIEEPRSFIPHCFIQHFTGNSNIQEAPPDPKP